MFLFRKNDFFTSISNHFETVTIYKFSILLKHCFFISKFFLQLSTIQLFKKLFLSGHGGTQ